MMNNSPEVSKTTSSIGLNFDDAGRIALIGGGAILIVTLLALGLNAAHQFAP